MAIIEPVRADIEHPGQTKKYSSSLRFWHWANAIVITGSLLTVLANKTVLNGWAVRGFIQENLKKSGTTITEEQTRSLVGGLRDRVWDYHVYFGYCLAALLLFRIIAEFFQLADQKLIPRIKDAWRQFKAGQNKLIARHEFIVKTLYAMFYLVLIMMAITGLCLSVEDDVPALHKMHFIREIHEFGLYLVLTFIVVHFAGVYLAERKDSKGIVSDMINGGAEK